MYVGLDGWPVNSEPLVYPIDADPLIVQLGPADTVPADELQVFSMAASMLALVNTTLISHICI